MYQAAPPPGQLTALDVGLNALRGIAASHRIAADPPRLAHELALNGREAEEPDRKPAPTSTAGATSSS